MQYITKELIEWAKAEIEFKYPEDVALLIGRKHPWRIEPDGRDIAFSYFVPHTDRGYKLSETFIIDGIGYDLFPRSWDRLEELAELNGDIGGILDAEILYAKSNAEVERFNKFKERASELLKDEAYCLNKAGQLLAEAMELYKQMVFDDNKSSKIMACGYIADYLSEAVGFLNGEYFVMAGVSKVEALENMIVPDGFIELYKAVYMDLENQSETVHSMIQMVRTFVSEKLEKADCDFEHFASLAEWYQELIYTFRRIRYYCEKRDAENAFAWGIMMQQELNYVTKTHGLKEMRLMEHYDSSQLEAFSKVSDDFEEYIVTVIEEAGVNIKSYSDLQSFLRAKGM